MYPTVESSKSYDKDYHKPRTVEELTQRNVETILQLDESAFPFTFLTLIVSLEAIFSPLSFSSARIVRRDSANGATT